MKQRLEQLRSEMKQRNISVYVIPTSDFHESEYVGDYFKARKYMTGFTGSAGTAVVGLTEAGLWTDGRYFIQAERQLEDSGFELYRMGEEDVEEIQDFIRRNLTAGSKLGFDGRVVNTKLGLEFGEIAQDVNASLHTNEDLVDLIWTDRPALSKEPAFVLEECYAGESVQSKLKRVREEMMNKKATLHVISSLYDIAWLLNIRGNDIHCVPVVLSFLIVQQDSCILFANEDAIQPQVQTHLKESNVIVRPYEEVYQYLPTISKDEVVWFTKNVSNYNLHQSIPAENEIIDLATPCIKMKSIKNEIELKNIEQAHIKDGVAVTKFMFWLKNTIGKETITELSAQTILEEYREQQELYMGPSFDTISAYGSNAAMMHYSASQESNATLHTCGMLLVDSGGHYLEGSTDITRTFVLGDITDEEKKDFTCVARGMLNLSAAKFLYGCTGINLDILARGPMWNRNIDYKCGTGHGIGYMLNVHEGPNGFRWRVVPERNDSAILEEGNVTTDEPGIYLEGKYGIRLENELVCRKGEKNEYGQFMYFQTVTMAPIDLDGIDPEEMTKSEREILNQYHRNVFETISPYLTIEEANWLKQYTRAI
ncbi:MAG: aminopeptidase P family protein [Lachnospiraceae bacterium]|nr:aminopeptidase P family protein [Lachnospiraceae bacterium]